LIVDTEVFLVIYGFDSLSSRYRHFFGTGAVFLSETNISLQAKCDPIFEGFLWDLMSNYWCVAIRRSTCDWGLPVVGVILIQFGASLGWKA